MIPPKRYLFLQHNLESEEEKYRKGGDKVRRKGKLITLQGKGTENVKRRINITERVMYTDQSVSANSIWSNKKCKFNFKNWGNGNAQQDKQPTQKMANVPWRFVCVLHSMHCQLELAGGLIKVMCVLSARARVEKVWRVMWRPSTATWGVAA